MDRNYKVLNKLKKMSLADEIVQTEVDIVMNRPLLCVTIHYIKANLTGYP